MRVVRHNWMYIAVAAALGLGLVIARVQTIPEQYKATSMIEMSVRRPRISSGEEAVLTDRHSWVNTEQVFNTRLKKFQDPRTKKIARQILQNQGVTDPIALAPASFSMVNDSFLVRISCAHTNPTNAALSANAFAEAAVQVMEQDNRESSESAVEWLRTQAAAQKDAVEKADQALAAFRAKHQLDLLESQIAAVRDSLTSLNRNQSELQSRIVTERELLAALEAGQIPQDLADAVDVREQQSVLRAARSRLQLLLEKYRTQHPAVQAEMHLVRTHEAAYQEVLAKHRQVLRDTINVLERQFAALRSQIEATQRDAAEKEARLVSLNSTQGALERELQAANMSYAGVLRRMEEARLSADEKTTAIKIAQLADPPVMPVYPRPMRSAAKGLIFGGFLGVLLAFAKDWLKDHVSSTEDVEDGLGLRVLGLFRREKITDRATLARAVLNNNPPAFTEAVAGLRTNLVMGGDEAAVRSLLVASAGVECGKTVTACNLALMFAMTGERTLIVDFDFRRPRIGRLLAKIPDKAHSLAHVLSDNQEQQIDFSALVQKGPHEKLAVIASAPDRNLHPAYLLGHASIKAFIEWAEEKYERVVIDSPPHGLLSDAMNLAAYVSGVIIVCRHDKSRKHGIARTIRALEHLHANLLGAVINAVPQGGLSAYDYYRGGYDFKDYQTLVNDVEIA